MNDEPTDDDLDSMVGSFVRRARAAQSIVDSYDQDRIDDTVRAIGWACYQEEHARELAELSVEETGMGNVDDRVVKITRKALMMMRDLSSAASVGPISADRQTGLTVLAKPVGLVAALCPSTHPATDLMAKAMMVVKGRNVMLASPSPGAIRTSTRTVELIRSELESIGAPPDVVQALPEPTRKRAAQLAAAADSVVVTGSGNNVRLASTSGTPTYAGGAGNVPVVVEPSADLSKAASDIARSKSFDYATACSSESVLLIHDDVYDRMIEQLVAHGGLVLSAFDSETLAESMWKGGRLNPKLVGRSPRELADLTGLEPPPADTRFFVVEETGVGPGHRFTGEKIAVVLAACRYQNFDDALRLVLDVLDYQGMGHSCGIHTGDLDHAARLAAAARVSRVIVNQPQGTAEAGSFANGLPATMVLGCGTWAGNVVSGNVTYQHFLNYTVMAEPLPERIPTEDELWGEYLVRYH